MSEPTQSIAVVRGPVQALAEEIREFLSAAGHTVAPATQTQSRGDASTVVYVAGAPADYAQAPGRLGQYVAAVLEGARAVLDDLLDDTGKERTIVLVAPSIGATLVAGAESISSAIGALKGLSRAWAVELGARGVRCNVVLPGILARDVTGSPLLPTIPLEGPDGRIGMDADVADAVVFLASGDASYLNGTELDVDGGLKEHRHAYASVLWDEGLYTPDHWPF